MWTNYYRKCKYFLSNDSRECHFVKIGNSLSFGVKDSHGIDGGNLNPLGDGQIELFVRVIDHQLRLTPLEVGLDDSVPHLLNLNKLMRLKWISWRVCIWISWHVCKWIRWWVFLQISWYVRLWISWCIWPQWIPPEATGKHLAKEPQSWAKNKPCGRLTSNLFCNRTL